jgi:sulfur carrier protein
MISINVNNKVKEVETNTSVAQLMQFLKQDKAGIAVAINNEIVMNSNWESTIIRSNDNVLLIKATQGG